LGQRFSIAIPSFQQGRYLERAILSVLDQGVETELFVLDGGSTDESVEVIRRHTDKIVFWRSHQDAGQTAAINEGLARATGNVFAYLNSDDYFLPGALSLAGQALEKNTASWVAGDAWFIREGQEGRQRLLAEEPPRDPVLLWGHPWCPPQPSTFWKTDLLRKVGPFRTDLKFNMDAEMAARLAHSGFHPAIIPKPLSVRWDHAQAKSAERWRFFKEWLDVVQAAPLSASQKKKALQLARNRIQWGRDVHPLGKWGQRLADLVFHPRSLFWFLRSRRKHLSSAINPE
jgi:glycosyltransferase involved in cell wall biosynthesis